MSVGLKHGALDACKVVFQNQAAISTARVSAPEALVTLLRFMCPVLSRGWLPPRREIPLSGSARGSPCPPF